MRSSFSSVNVGGIPFCVTDLRSAVEKSIQFAHSRSVYGHPIRLANAYCVALAHADSSYWGVLSGAGSNFPDGTPVGWSMRLISGISRKASKPRSVRGPSFFELALDLGRKDSTRHFFVGSTPDTLELLVGEIERRYPGALVVGSYSPPFADVSDEYIADIANVIGSTAPHMIWLGLGTPKQDFVSAALAQRVSVPVIGVGAAFDFVAGTVREAPRFLHNSGFEWVFRLVTEPRRLWRRYVLGNLKFLYVVASGMRDSISDANRDDFPISDEESARVWRV